MPPSSSPSTTTSTLASVVLLTFKLLLPFGVLSQYSLLFRNLLRIALYPDGWLWQVGRPAGVRLLAVLAIGTKPRQIELTQSLPNVLLGAIWAERAEPFFVVWAWGKLLGGVDM
jgi:hypothetical protein